MSRDVTGDLPQIVVPSGTTRHGLVIGIDKYADERLNLRCAVADARALHALMVDAGCGCFPPENVQLLLDSEATTEGIFRTLARFRRRVAENDVVWIYYAGHAAVDDNAYWVTHDTDVDDLFATALNSERINSVLCQLRTSNVLLILDCCHAAATALVKNQTRTVVTANDVFGRFQGHGRITLAASDGKQKSVELTEFGHGAFTYFLEKGLRGDGDTDNDGIVTADELWAYLRHKVTEASGRVGTPQTPILSGSMTHDVALTLNAAATANKQRLLRQIEQIVGLRPHQLTTGEGTFCEEILLRGARTEPERSLLQSLEELADGQLTQLQFRRLVQANLQVTGRPAPLTAEQAPHTAPDAAVGTFALEDCGETVIPPVSADPPRIPGEPEAVVRREVRDVAAIEPHRPLCAVEDPRYAQAMRRLELATEEADAVVEPAQRTRFYRPSDADAAATMNGAGSEQSAVGVEPAPPRPETPTPRVQAAPASEPPVSRPEPATLPVHGGTSDPRHRWTRWRALAAVAAGAALMIALVVYSTSSQPVSPSSGSGGGGAPQQRGVLGEAIDAPIAPVAPVTAAATVPDAGPAEPEPVPLDADIASSEHRGSASPPPPLPRGPYPVRIDTLVPGTAIYIDERSRSPVGVTPWEGKLDFGDHTVTLEAPGYEPATRTFPVARVRRIQNLFVTLVKKVDPPKIDVRADADKNVLGATILLDGQPQGQAPMVLTTTSGSHLLEIKKDGFETYSTWLQTKATQVLTWSSTIKAIARPRYGTVVVAADVFDAEVFIDGTRHPDNTPAVISNVIEGLHVIEVRKPPRLPWKRTIEVKASQMTKVRAEMAAALAGGGVGTIQVQSVATGARVYFDGADVGPSPVEIKNVKAGEHTVQVKAPEFQPSARKVTVTAGSSQIVKFGWFD